MENHSTWNCHISLLEEARSLKAHYRCTDLAYGILIMKELLGMKVEWSLNVPCPSQACFLYEQILNNYLVTTFSQFFQSPHLELLGKCGE